MSDFNEPIDGKTYPMKAESPYTTGSPVQAGEGIYIASKTVHAPRWRQLRATGVPIVSTWIDEAGVGETKAKWIELGHDEQNAEADSFEDLWRRCVSEAQNANALIVYREPGETLKGALIEVGAALAFGVPVFAVGCQEFSFSNHRNVMVCGTFDDALKIALTAKNIKRFLDPAQTEEMVKREVDSFAQSVITHCCHEPSVVRVCEGGGPEDPQKTLSVSVLKMKNSIFSLQEEMAMYAMLKGIRDARIATLEAQVNGYVPPDTVAVIEEMSAEELANHFHRSLATIRSQRERIAALEAEVAESKKLADQMTEWASSVESYNLTPKHDEAIEKLEAERDGLKAENERLKQDSDHWHYAWEMADSGDQEFLCKVGSQFEKKRKSLLTTTEVSDEAD